MKSKKQPARKGVYSPPLLKLISIVAIAYFIVYIVWRAVFTLNPDAVFISWLLWGAEAFGVLNYILFAWMTKEIAPRVPHKPPRAGISVDVFVPTYNEGVEILEATLTGCRKMNYPHQTYILDDGKREVIRELAERLGANYLIRPTNEHAKAGNINYALANTHGEFIVILDADMVPQPDFIERTLGYFEDERLAFIQLPQEFYNEDSIQHDVQRPGWHEQALFFRVIQPGKNYSNSAFWCGSPSIVRRKALEDVGEVATETITEDIHTSVRLHSRGWSSMFVNEPLAYGIAPQTIKAFLLQRLRWAQGTMQLYRSKENPLWIPGLTWRQRLSYLSSFLAYFESFQKLILIFTPTLILAFNLFPMKVDIVAFLLFWSPYFGLNLLANRAGGRGVFRYFKTEKFNILKMIVFIESTLTLFSRKPLKFKVTPKAVDATVYDQERRSLRAYMAIFGALIGVVFYGLIRILVWHSNSSAVTVTLIALVWALYNAIVILSALVEILQKQHERKQYRFPVKLSARLYDRSFADGSVPVRVTDLSVSGVSFMTQKQLLRTDARPLLHVFTSTRNGLILPVNRIHYQTTMTSGKTLVGASFMCDAGFQRELLFEYLFVTLPRLRASTMTEQMTTGIALDLQRFFRPLLPWLTSTRLEKERKNAGD